VGLGGLPAAFLGYLATIMYIIILIFLHTVKKELIEGGIQ
jgi:hypothetical protein